VGFTFGEYFLDADRRELWCGRAVVPLAPQVFDVLLYLLRNRDRVVTKDDLLGAVWGGRIVSESALTTRISAARTAIGDSGQAQQLIRTLPRKGFRFIGLVREAGILEAPTDAPPPPASEHSDKLSIAVLPFANMGADPERENFADGLAEEIITALSRIQRILVVARSPSGVPKGQIVDVKQIGREMGVRYVLEGSVRKLGSRVRIAAQLIDAASGAHLWADRYDGSLDAVFELHDRVAIGVAAAIQSALQSAQINGSADFIEQAKVQDARPPDPILAERRQLTVVYCNLVEMTALTSRLDRKICAI
jgi:TolB-like protein